MSKASHNKKHAHLFGLNDPLSAPHSSTPTNDDPLSRSASPSSAHTSDPLSFLSRRGQSSNARPQSPLIEDADLPRPASSVSYASRRGSSGSNSSGSSTPVPAASLSSMPTSRAAKVGTSSSSIFGDIDVAKLGGGSIFSKKPQLKLRSRLDHYADEEDIFGGSSRRRAASNDSIPVPQSSKSPFSSRPQTPASVANSDEEHIVKQDKEQEAISVTKAREDQAYNTVSPKIRLQTSAKPVAIVNNSQPVNDQLDSSKATSPPYSTLPTNQSPSSTSASNKILQKTSSSIFASAASNIARARSPKASPHPAEPPKSNGSVSPPEVQQQVPVSAGISSPEPAPPPKTERIVKLPEPSVKMDNIVPDHLNSPAPAEAIEQQFTDNQISQTPLFEDDPETIAFRNDMSFSFKPAVPNTSYLDPIEPYPPSNDDLHTNIIPHTTINSNTADIDDPWQSSIIPTTTTLHTPSMTKPNPDFDLSAFQPLDIGHPTGNNLKVNSSSIPENKRNAFSDLISSWNSGSVGEMEFRTDPAYLQDDNEFYERVASQQSDVGFKGIEGDRTEASRSGYSDRYQHSLPDRLGDLSLSENPWS
ncbi:hypothetical protein Unana1_08533 [Umbelopsis nana]